MDGVINSSHILSTHCGSNDRYVTISLRFRETVVISWIVVQHCIIMAFNQQRFGMCSAVQLDNVFQTHLECLASHMKAVNGI